MTKSSSLWLQIGFPNLRYLSRTNQSNKKVVKGMVGDGKGGAKNRYFFVMLTHDSKFMRKGIILDYNYLTII